MITDNPTRVYIYSSKAWIDHCMSSCRRLGLNKDILQFTKDGLEGYGTTVADYDLLKYFQDILHLCREDTVS
jgi:hypothetical protein